MFASIVLRAQTIEKVEKEVDSIVKIPLIHQVIADGYIPTSYFNFDMRYLFKYNQYEALRTGIGGYTNTNFHKHLKLNAYLVYGFRDAKFKYQIGAAYVINKAHDFWVNAAYTDDLIETGSTLFLTEKRSYQFFEPRLLNISLFYHHKTKSVGFGYKLIPQLNAVTDFSISTSQSTSNYIYKANNIEYNAYNITALKSALEWSTFETTGNTNANKYKVTLQYTKSFKNAFQGDFNFSKVDFLGVYQWGNVKKNYTQFTTVAGAAFGNVPLTHLYHASPNNINKETVLQRFSVGGINSFETMLLNEFFSDKFTTFQVKHFLKPFAISANYHPQLVLVSRYAIGDIETQDNHQNISYNTIDKGYLESGIELNNLLFGFGFSFTYRYGAYHLPQINKNLALKFTFNLTL